MRKSILRSGVMAAIALAVSLTLTGCGGKSEPATSAGNSGPSEEEITALDGSWVNEKGYAIQLDGFGGSYDLKTPSGRVGSSNYYIEKAPDEYSIYFNESFYDLALMDDGNLSLVPTEDPEEGKEALQKLVFTKDESAFIYFDLADLNGTWNADGASLTLDIDAMEYRYTSDSTTAEGTINNDEDGRGWYISWSYSDTPTGDMINDPAFLVVDDAGQLHLEAKDPEVAPFTFVQEGTEANIPADREIGMLEFQVSSGGAWVDDAGNAMAFKDEDGKYILQMANGRNGSGKLSFNAGREAYEISFNGADYALAFDEDDSDIMYLTLVSGTPAGDGESLDGKRFTHDIFMILYDNPASFLHGSFADDAGFKLKIDSLYDDEIPKYEYVSRKGSDSGILSNDEDGRGWYIPWNDSDGKAYLIHDGYGSSETIRFETDDPALAAVTLTAVEE